MAGLNKAKHSDGFSVMASPHYEAKRAGQLSVIMNEVVSTAIELKRIFEVYSSRSDAVASGYGQNRTVIEKALAGEDITYHLSVVNLGFIRVLQDSWDLEEAEFKQLIRAISNFDEALKRRYG